MKCKGNYFIVFAIGFCVIGTHANENWGLASQGQFQGTKQVGHKLDYRVKSNKVGRYMSPEYSNDWGQEEFLLDILESEIISTFFQTNRAIPKKRKSLKERIREKKNRIRKKRKEIRTHREETREKRDRSQEKEKRERALEKREQLRGKEKVLTGSE